MSPVPFWGHPEANGRGDLPQKSTSETQKGVEAATQKPRICLLQKRTLVWSWLQLSPNTSGKAASSRGHIAWKLSAGRIDCNQAHSVPWKYFTKYKHCRGANRLKLSKQTALLTIAGHYIWNLWGWRLEEERFGGGEDMVLLHYTHKRYQGCHLVKKKWWAEYLMIPQNRLQIYPCTQDWNPTLKWIQPWMSLLWTHGSWQMSCHP